MADKSYYILITKKLETGYRNHTVSEPLNLSLERGTLTSLIGTNGCGKSTLIRTLSGLQNPLGGTVYVLDQKLNSLSGSKKAKIISHVLTDGEYMRSITVRDIVAMGRMPYTNFLGHLTSSDIEIVEQSMHQVCIDHKADKLLYELSDGERQRTFIAKALAQDTPVIFLDEPTSYLDMRNKIEIMDLLHTLAHEKQKTILLSTHDVDIALQASDKIWLLDKGRMITGVPEDLILSGKIGEIFRSDAFLFNMETASFKLNYRPIGMDVVLSGDACVEMDYTLQALRRCGFRVTNQTYNDIEIPVIRVVSPENQKNGIAEWVIEFEHHKETRYNIENLLHEL